MELAVLAGKALFKVEAERSVGSGGEIGATGADSGVGSVVDSLVDSVVDSVVDSAVGTFVASVADPVIAFTFSVGKGGTEGVSSGVVTAFPLKVSVG